MINQFPVFCFLLTSALMPLKLFDGYKQEEKTSISINSNNKHCFDVAMYQPSAEQKEFLMKALQGSCDVFRSDGFYNQIKRRDWHTGRRIGPLLHRHPEIVDRPKVVDAVKQTFQFHLFVDKVPSAQAQTDQTIKSIVIKESRFPSTNVGEFVNSISHEVMHLLPGEFLGSPTLTYAFEDGSRRGRDLMVSYQIGDLAECYYNALEAHEKNIDAAVDRCMKE